MNVFRVQAKTIATNEDQHMINEQVNERLTELSTRVEQLSTRVEQLSTSVEQLSTSVEQLSKIVLSLLPKNGPFSQEMNSSEKRNQSTNNKEAEALNEPIDSLPKENQSANENEGHSSMEQNFSSEGQVTLTNEKEKTMNNRLAPVVETADRYDKFAMKSVMSKLFIFILVSLTCYSSRCHPGCTHSYQKFLSIIFVK